MRIGVFGHYGNANMGDEAIVQATLESLRQRVPDIELACFTMNEADSEARHGVPSYPIRRTDNPPSPFEMAGEPDRPVSEFTPEIPVSESQHQSRFRSVLKRIAVLRFSVLVGRHLVAGVRNLPGEIGFLYRNYKLLKSFDLLMVTGSNQFLDNFGGVWGFPYTVLKWSILARLAGCKLALVSLGAGPLNGWWSKRFCRWSLALAHHASYRDHPSRELIEGAGPYKGKVYPDVAHNIDVPPPVTAEADAPLRVGINPMPVYDRRYWHAKDDNLYDAYIDKLVALVRHVLTAGHEPCLFSTQIQDNNVIGDVLSRLDDEENAAVRVRQPRSVDALLEVLAQLDVSVPTRFHGSVLSIRTGLPTLGICYHRKIGDLLTDVGLSEYQVTFEEFTVERITSLLDRLVAEREWAAAKASRASARYVADLDKQYEELVALARR